MDRVAQRVADAIVVGGGIVGAACASELAGRGMEILVIDATGRSATAAGMGHLVHLTGNPAELALCAYSLALWRALAPRLPAACAYRPCGTLWVAESAEDRPGADAKQALLAEHGVASEWLDPAALARAEPMLRHGLAGALRVSADAIVYAPATARWLLRDAGPRLSCRRATVTALGDRCVQVDDEEWLGADHVVLANGLGANALIPALHLVAKKGQLAITDRYPPMVRHQLVDLAYTRQAHAHAGASIAFNVQPRPTGQILIGSSRQPGDEDPAIDGRLLSRMLRRALAFLPGLGNMTVIRTWAGFRPATVDDRPLIGLWPEIPGLWLALGHEGHGVTTAPGTAHLLADLVCNQVPAIDAGPYRTSRAARRNAIP